jgi:hypothetical protein
MANNKKGASNASPAASFINQISSRLRDLMPASM